MLLQNDINRKPQGQIVLDEICRITRADGAATFEISTGKKTYYLTADSIATMEDWIRVLQVSLSDSSLMYREVNVTPVNVRKSVSIIYIF